MVSYKEATSSLSLILCNEIINLDQTALEVVYPEDFYDNEDEDFEITQYYLTDANANDAKVLSEKYGLIFSYSEMLDLYVLCVDHYGTPWESVECNVY